MKDKFKENFFIALPAAIVSLVIIYNLSVKNYSGGVVQEEYHLIQAIPFSFQTVLLSATTVSASNHG